jgi:hypothetical protein
VGGWASIPRENGLSVSIYVGNLGGACTQLLMDTIIFPIFEDYYDGDSAKALKVIFVVPAAIALSWG